MMNKMIEFEGKTLQLWIFSKRVCENMCEYIDSVNQKEKHPPFDSKVIFQVKLEEVLFRHQQQEDSSLQSQCNPLFLTSQLEISG